jgi:Gluconate 2-dehydrogenase subunit 3
VRNEPSIVKEPLARKISRRELAQAFLSGLAGGVLLPSLSPLHPVYGHLVNGQILDSADEALAAKKHKPVFLSESQFLSFEKITEALVPGSERAQSAAFIDLLLSVDSATSQQGFTGSLTAFEATADRTYHKSIVALSKAQLNELLREASIKGAADYAHFENLKGWTVGAYYSSEIGMSELGWTPDRVFSTFPTCTHAESHS